MANYVIDQAATFAGVAFIQCNPKKAFGSEAQETAKDGTPKWEVEVLGAAYKPFGEGTTNEVIKIGITSHKNPGEGLAPFTPVQLVDFQLGIMDKVKRNPDGSEKVIGHTVWHRASAIRSTAETAPLPGKAA